jgi:hypothetical protein
LTQIKRDVPRFTPRPAAFTLFAERHRLAKQGRSVPAENHRRDGMISLAASIRRPQGWRPAAGSSLAARSSRGASARWGRTHLLGSRGPLLAGGGAAPLRQQRRSTSSRSPRSRRAHIATSFSGYLSTSRAHAPGGAGGCADGCLRTGQEVFERDQLRSNSLQSCAQAACLTSRGSSQPRRA